MRLHELRTGDRIKFTTEAFEFGDTWAVIFSLDGNGIDAYGAASRQEARNCAKPNEWLGCEVAGRIARIVKATKDVVTVEVSK